jgi:phage shock protein C
MNKTVNANIGGLIFNIDEDAYRVLHQYLDKLKNYFQQSEGSTEILDDIEARIAELLQETIGGREIVNMKDVKNVMAAMGQPEEFEEETGEPTKQKTYTGDYSRERVQKRLFRNPDDRMLGGVCSGISSYLGVDPIWLRLAFVVALLVFGTGILVYIILWIIIPEAKTTAEKLQMRGERVDINNIERSVKEEMDRFGKQIKDFGDDLKKNFKSNQTFQKSRTGVEGFFQSLAGLIVNIAKLFIRFIGVILAICGVIILLSLVFGLFGISSALTFSLPFFSSFIFENNLQAILASIGLGLLVIIPVLWIITWGIMAIIGSKGSRYLNWAYMSVWLAGLILTLFVVARVGIDFRTKGMVKQVYSLENYEKDTLYVELTKGDWPWQDDYAYPDETEDFESAGDYFNLNNDSLILNDVELKTRVTDDSVFSLVTYYFARGSNRNKARTRAGKMDYEHTFRDSTLSLSPVFNIGKQRWRHQHIRMILYIPKNKVAIISNDLDFMLHPRDRYIHVYPLEIK